jgi:A/G-specific adenine glycosylase
MQKAFTNLLLNWNQSGNLRTMPWKGERDPYRIWLSEVILQQTRVEQGLAYYNRFIEKYHTIRDLALAPDEDVFKLWEGLGYYSRCRNLLATARFIAFERNGRFPDTFEEILSLKGIGPYTAAAIASFAYGLPHAVLDGNVFRVLSRYFGITTPVDQPEGKKLYTRLANELLDTDSPGTYNQAIMDFGATICKPRQPLCQVCVQRNDCEANKLGIAEQLPVKSKSLVRRTRFFYYYIFSYEGGFYIRQRSDSDIWHSLYEWALVETEEAMKGEKKDLMHALRNAYGNRLKGNIISVSDQYSQQLTHQKINGCFIHMELDHPLPEQLGFRFITRKQLGNFAFPRFITRYLEKHPL